MGRTIRRAEVLKADILREPKRTFGPKVRGATIEGVDRRAKNVLVRLDRSRVIAVNLGMTGRLLPFDHPPSGNERPTHPAVRFRFEDGGLLVFDDVRRFGTVECLDAEAWKARSDRMGPEPLDDSFRPADLHERLTRSRMPMRSWLLDQKKIAGVGNIYAAEALYLAGIHPLREASSVEEKEAVRLHRSIRKVLAEAIDAGGTTIRDYRNADGGEGEYARQLHVYGREGAPCHACGEVVEKTVLSNRSAFYCPTCQPAS